MSNDKYLENKHEILGFMTTMYEQEQLIVISYCILGHHRWRIYLTYMAYNIKNEITRMNFVIEKKQIINYEDDIEVKCYFTKQNYL